MTTNEIIIFATLEKNEKKEIMQLRDEYGFSISAIVIHIAHYTARTLIKGKSIAIVASPKMTIARCALDLYRPFSLNFKNPDQLTLTYHVSFSQESLYEDLKRAGILKPTLFFAAIARAIIKYPYDASRIKVQGVYTKKSNSLLRVKGLRNTMIHALINLPIEVYGILKDIAKRNGSSMQGMVINVVKSVCNIDFNNYTFTENHKVFKKLILEPARVFEQNMHRQYGRLNVNISDLRLSVQLKAVIEKYGIPSIRDFFKRVVYFIISVHNGDVKLNTVRIEDYDDYNETRMVRNAYKNEVIYGTH